MFFEQQISILELFLKNRVTLKTEDDAENCYYIIYAIIKYVNTENSTFCNDISQYYCFIF